MPSIHKNDDGPDLIWAVAIVLCAIAGAWWGPFFLIGLILLAVFIIREGCRR